MSVSAFTSAGAVSVKRGDVDWDNNINIRDAVKTLQHAVTIMLLSPEKQRIADVTEPLNSVISRTR